MNPLTSRIQSANLISTFDNMRARLTAFTNEFDKLKSVSDQPMLDKLKMDLTKLNHCLAESNFIDLIDSYVCAIETDRQNLILEKDLLRYELDYTRGKLDDAGAEIVQLEEQKRIDDYDRTIKKLNEQLDKSFSLVKQQSFLMEDWDIVSVSSAEEAEENMVDVLSDNNNIDELINAAVLIKEEYCMTSIDAQNLNHKANIILDYFMHYLESGHYEIVEPLCRHVIQDLNKKNESDHMGLAVMLDYLSKSCHVKKEYKDAIKHLKEALSIYKVSHDANHPIIAKTMDRIKYLEEKCLTLETKNMSSNNTSAPPTLVKHLKNIAMRQQREKRYKEAICNYEDAILLCDDESDFEESCKLKLLLADIYYELDQYKEAGELYKSILTLAHKNNVARLHNKPIWKVAEQVEDRKLNYNRRFSGGDSYQFNCDFREWHEKVNIDLPFIMSAMKRLSFVYRRMGKYTAAKVVDHCCTIQDRKRLNLSMSSLSLATSSMSITSSSDLTPMKKLRKSMSSTPLLTTSLKNIPKRIKLCKF